MLKEKKMNTKLMKATIGLTLVKLLISACGILPTFGSRNLITENRPVSGFNRLDISGGGDVTIIQDGTESLTIETDDNVMQYVTSEVRGGTLYVGLEFHSLRSIIPSRLSLTLHVKDLTGISSSGSWNMVSESLQAGNLDIAISGSGKVTVNTLNTDKLNVHISGSGNMDLAGNLQSQEVSISGSGTYRAGDLQTQDTKISVSGSGNVTVWATGSLNASVSGNGTINYYGSPQVTFDQSGSGDLKNLGNK
jgi:hypothetical protein